MNGIVLSQAGEMVPADAVMMDPITILCNESSLTGEPEDLKKNRNNDCFLLSSCLITEGEDSKALSIGIGLHSQWGKIKANLVSESVNTPLQDKLEDMATMVCSRQPLLVDSKLILFFNRWLDR